MTRKETDDFIDSAVKLLAPKTTFGRGRVSEWNSRRDHVYPKVWRVTNDEDEVATEFSPQMTPIDSRSIELRIAFKDAHDSVEDQYENLVDLADRHAQRLLYALNQVVTSVPTALITGISRRAFIKKNADDVTGVILSFTIQSADLTSNCE